MIDKPGISEVDQDGAYGPSRGTYDLSRSILSAALALEAIAGASIAAEAAGVAVAAAGLGAAAATLGLAAAVAGAVVAAIGLCGVETGEPPSWIGSFSGLLAATGAGIAGASERGVNEAGKLATVVESVLMWNPGGSGAVATVGETVSVGADVADYVADAMSGYDDLGEPSFSPEPARDVDEAASTTEDDDSGWPSIDDDKDVYWESDSPTIELEAGGASFSEIGTGDVDIGGEPPGGHDYGGDTGYSDSEYGDSDYGDVDYGDADCGDGDSGGDWGW